MEEECELRSGKCGYCSFCLKAGEVPQSAKLGNSEKGDLVDRRRGLPSLSLPTVVYKRSWSNNSLQLEPVTGQRSQDLRKAVTIPAYSVQPFALAKVLESPLKIG